MDKFGKGKIDIDFAIRGGGYLFSVYIAQIGQNRLLHMVDSAMRSDRAHAHQRRNVYEIHKTKSGYRYRPVLAYGCRPRGTCRVCGRRR